jgi:hypothetical protein
MDYFRMIWGFDIVWYRLSSDSVRLGEITERKFIPLNANYWIEEL